MALSPVHLLRRCIKSIVCHAAGTGIATATAQVYFCPVGVSSASTNKIFDVDVTAGETVLLEPSYPLVLDTTGDSSKSEQEITLELQPLTLTSLITGDKEFDTWPNQIIPQEEVVKTHFF